MTRFLAATLCAVNFISPVTNGAVAGTGGRAPDVADKASEPAVLTVRVIDLRNRKGQLRLGVFDGSRGFPKERGAALLWKSVAADAEHRCFTVELPPGQYAAVVLHDENGNRKIDRNFVGIPKEGYGVTNNPKPATRAATYREAAFDLPPAGAEVRVSTQYF